MIRQSGGLDYEHCVLTIAALARSRRYLKSSLWYYQLEYKIIILKIKSDSVDIPHFKYVNPNYPWDYHLEDSVDIPPSNILGITSSTVNSLLSHG